MKWQDIGMKWKIEKNLYTESYEENEKYKQKFCEVLNNKYFSTVFYSNIDKTAGKSGVIDCFSRKIWGLLFIMKKLKQSLFLIIFAKCCFWFWCISLFYYFFNFNLKWFRNFQFVYNKLYGNFFIEEGQTCRSCTWCSPCTYAVEKILWLRCRPF